MVALDIDSNVLKVAMSCSVVLYVKFFCTTMIQGGKRFSGGSRPPEDEKLSLAKKFKAKQTYGLEKCDNPKLAEDDIRWQRIVLNDLENIPIGMLLMWGSALCPKSTVVHMASAVTFTLARIGHTYTYANAMQPGRGICWGLAHIACIALCVNGMIGVFTK